MARDPNVVTRKIHFYRIRAERDEAGRPMPFDARRRLQPLRDLRFDDGSAYLDANDQVTCGWVDGDAGPVQLRVADIRRQYLPALEHRGQLGRLDIAEDSGLAEQVHITFFDNNVVASEFNFYGPRMSRVGFYLSRKLGGPPVTFEALIRGDIVRELDRLQDIRLFQLRVHPAYVEEIRRSRPQRRGGAPSRSRPGRLWAGRGDRPPGPQVPAAPRA